MILTQIPIEHTRLIPERAVHDIVDALEYGQGERQLKHIVEDIESGESQLWIKFTDEMEHVATAVTKIINFPSQRVCAVECAGGREGLLEAVTDIKAIEDWAKYNGCEEVRILGRKGWLKVLRDHGYQEHYIVLGKKL